MARDGAEELFIHRLQVRCHRHPRSSTRRTESEMAHIGVQSENLWQQASTVMTGAVRTAVTVSISIAIFSTGAVQGQVALAAQAGSAQPGTATSLNVVEREPNQAGQQCFEATGTHHAKTLIGNTFYRFTHRANWCTDGVNVVSVDNREHEMTDVDAFASFEGLVEDYTSKVPAPEVTSIMKGRVDNCVPVQGCISSKYPFVELTLRADGTWFPTTGESESS
jgi:hypothetical protein